MTPFFLLENLGTLALMPALATQDALKRAVRKSTARREMTPTLQGLSTAFTLETSPCLTSGTLLILTAFPMSRSCHLLHGHVRQKSLPSQRRGILKAYEA